MSIDATVLKPWCSVSRVLMTSDASGAGWNHAVDLSRALGQYGVQVVLLCLGRRLTQAQHRDVWSIPSLALYEENLRAEWMEEPWRDVERAGEILLDLEARYHPDVIHLHGAAQAALPFRAPVVVELHGCALSYVNAVLGEQPLSDALEVYRRRVKEGLACASMVVARSASGLSELSALYGPFQHSRVLPHGCDPDAYLPDMKEEFVLSAGRLWDPARNLGALARVSASITWPVYLADDAQRLPHTSRMVQLRPPGAMRNLGKLSRAELASWFGRASIYVQPGRYDPSGVAALEAAASGCALVLSDIPSLREVWEDVAVFVDPNDELQLVAAVNALIRERSSREALANAARERAFGFSLAQLATQTLALYTELATRRRTGDDAQAWARSSTSGGNESALL